MNDLINVPWYTKSCSQENCWCLIICTDPKSDEMETCVVASGGIPRKYAEHVVALHNAWLAARA